MYFSLFKLKKWGKKTSETRGRNCAVLPFYYFASARVLQSLYSSSAARRVFATG